MPQVLSHEQGAPIRQQQNERRLMPPPPTPVQIGQPSPVRQARQTQRVMTPRVPDQSQFPQSKYTPIGEWPIHYIPFPDARQLQDHVDTRQRHAHGTGTGEHQTLGQAPRRFIPPGASNSQRFAPPTPSHPQQRFVPQTPTTGNGRRFAPSSSSGIRAAQGRSGLGNGTAQRSAFAPSR